MNKEEVQNYLVENTINWRNLKRLAIIHKIEMPIFEAFKHLPIELIDKEVYNEFKLIATQKLFQNLSLSKELIELKNLCLNNNIETIFYKGSCMSIQLYQTLSLRSSGDIDFLIKKNDFSKLTALLSKRGYVPEFRLLTNKELRQYFKISPEYNFDYFENQIRKYHVEPHHSLIIPLYAIDTSFELLKKHTTEIDLNRNKVNTFNINFIPIVLSIHHGAGDGWSILKYVFEWYVLIVNFADKINWKEVKENAALYDIELYLYVSIAIVNNLMKVEIPKELKEQVLDNRIQKLAFNRIEKIRLNNQGKRLESGYRKLWFRFISSKRIFTKVKIVASVFSAIFPLINLYLFSSKSKVIK